jgi:hypothetical protein
MSRYGPDPLVRSGVPVVSDGPRKSWKHDPVIASPPSSATKMPTSYRVGVAAMTWACNCTIAVSSSDVQPSITPPGATINVVMLRSFAVH